MGPLLRYVGRTDATIWVETDEPCRVEVLGRVGRHVRGRGSSLCHRLPRGPRSRRRASRTRFTSTGFEAWPPDDYEFPAPRIRLMPDNGSLQLLFGSCRASAPHRPPFTCQRWWNRKGKGIDMLRSYGMRMLRQPSALWPDAMMMLGDQLYADQVSDSIKELVADREVHANGPVEVLEDFEEYSPRLLGYVAGARPSGGCFRRSRRSMIFDDHEINDKWNTSQAWLDEKRQTEWYADQDHRRTDGLLDLPASRQPVAPRPRRGKNVSHGQRERSEAATWSATLAKRAESQDGPSRFSFSRDLGPARLLMVDSRTSRQLQPGRRRIVSVAEWDWIKSQVDGNYEHLLIASSLPFLLPAGAA